MPIVNYTVYYADANQIKYDLVRYVNRQILNYQTRPTNTVHLGLTDFLLQLTLTVPQLLISSLTKANSGTYQSQITTNNINNNKNNNDTICFRVGLPCKRKVMTPMVFQCLSVPQSAPPFTTWRL